MRKIVRRRLMKYTIVALLLLLASVVSPAQLPKDFSSRYDKFKDQTTIERKASIIMAAKGSRSKTVGAIYFKPVLVHTGQTLQSDVQAFTLVFRSESMLCRAWCFHENSGLIIMADGERISLGDGVWDGSVGRTTEVMVYTISRPDLERVVAAKVVEFQIGDFEGKFAENDSNAAKTILELGTARK